ncbi:GNAT family N-acetyltransferase [uncultured Roseobacter sp.]|uniref:GNAT family N-acetyltransferase n=1 Tax=uncultured Roseobacter sp. TaxID=114847 RepID=UPI002612BE1B|nr:GNAT family N-acetyltransferase [uncultured Roseobacter sp.]
MDKLALTPITQAQHSEDALDLAIRAADYVTLEVGHIPDAAFIHGFFTAAPPGLGPQDLQHFAMMEETAMAGMVCIAAGYEYPTDWWIGLMLLDPAFRGRGIGRVMLELIRGRAREAGVGALKLAVLEANTRGTKFWLREGFLPHRYAAATPDSDGHNRWVLAQTL